MENNSPRTTAHNETKEPLLESILTQLRIKRIVSSIPQNSAVLDLGCGFNAKLLKKIENKLSSGLGIDLSVNQNFTHPKIKLLAHDLNEKLPLENGSFDVVISLANLEHLNNPDLNIQEIHRVLKPGGTLLLTTPSTYAKPILEFLAYHLHLISEQEIRDHKNYFDKNSLTQLCQKYGFSKINHHYFQLGVNNFLVAVK